jgi:hypothetical protein
MHRMGLDFWTVRQCGSAATMQTHLSPVHYRNLLSNVTTNVFVAGVYHWLPIHLNRCWATPLYSMSLHLAPLCLAAAFIISVLGCTSKSTTKCHVPCVISGFCLLDDKTRTAKNNDLSVLIWISVFKENISHYDSQNKRYWNSVVDCWITEQVTQLFHRLPK